MCKFKSAICFKNGDVLHDKYIDSHEDLILKFGLKESKMRGWIRGEFYPDSTNDLADTSKYKFHVDDDIKDWVNDELIEKWSRKLRAIIKKMIVNENTPILSGGRWILKGDVKINTAAKGCLVLHGGKAQVKDGGYMQVVYGGYMRVEYGGSMQVKYGHSMRVKHGSYMQVKDGGSMLVEYGHYMRVEYGGSMQVKDGGYMQVEFTENAKIKNAGNAKIINK